MPLIIYIFLLFSPALFAQELAQADILADSAEFLIYEDIDLDIAQQLNQKAAVMYLKTKNQKGQVHCQINNACFWAQKDSFKFALELINAVAPSMKKISDTTRLAGLFLTTKAWSLWGIGRYKEAYEAAVKATEILRQKQDWERFVMASLLATYAVYYGDESNFSDIDRHIEETYQTALKYLPPSRLAYKYIYQLYGSILYQQGRLDQAIELHHEGLNYEYQFLAKNQLRKDSSIVAKYYSNLGKIYGEKNDTEQSIAYFKSAFILYQNLKNYAELLKLCSRLGELCHQKELRKEADSYYSKIPYYVSLMSKNPVLQRRENIYEHVSMAAYYSNFNYNDSILLYYNTHLPYIRENNLDVDKAYINIGMAFEALDDYAKAEEFYKKALTIQKKKYGQSGIKIASTYFKLGHLKSEQGNNKEAIIYMDSVITILDASPDSETDKIMLLEYLLDKSIAIEAYQHRADVLLNMGQLEKAHQDFNSVILLANYLRDNYSDNESKLVSINKLRPVYEKAAATAWSLYHNTKDEFYKKVIFDYAEHSKSSLLNENILKFRNTYKEGGVGIPKHLLQAEEKFIVQIEKCREHIIEAKKEQKNKKEDFYSEKLLHLEQTLDSFERSLQAQYPSYRTWDHGHDSITSIKTVQSRLKPTELFVEYFISDNHAFVIYISKTETKIKEVPQYNTDDFKTRIRNLRRTISNIEYIMDFEQEAYTIFCEEASWLYTHFLEDDMLKGKQHLIIVPDQHLHYIPFEVMLTKAPKNKKDIDYQDLEYLIKTYNIHYEYSAAIMANSEKRPNTTSGKILGFAAVYGNTFSYEDLLPSIQKERTAEEVKMHSTAFEIPGTVSELKALSNWFEGDFFWGQDASENRFKKTLSQNQYSVVHLAMHGVVNYDHPAYSSLVFTEDLDTLEDNLLYSYETQHLNGENANLVVLSACKTGSGQFAQGEGIISLGRSFMYAGIPSIVMTLWELNDQTSVEVMDFFYDNLSNGQTKDEAMRNAKLKYLKNNKGLTAHPFFWASFICIGNQQAIPLDYKGFRWGWWIGGFLVFGLGAAAWRYRGRMMS